MGFFQQGDELAGDLAVLLAVKHRVAARLDLTGGGPQRIDRGEQGGDLCVQCSSGAQWCVGGADHLLDERIDSVDREAGRPQLAVQPVEAGTEAREQFLQGSVDRSEVAPKKWSS